MIGFAVAVVATTVGLAAAYERLQRHFARVSRAHSSALVSEMATEAVWLHRGKVRMQGEVDTVSDAYKAFLDESSETAQLQSNKEE